MPRPSGLSFRILHPSPRTFWGPSLSPSHLQGSIESYQGSPRSLKRVLGDLPWILVPDPKKGGPWVLSFSAPAHKVLALARTGKLGSALSRQVLEAHTGLYRTPAWDLGSGFRWGKRTLVMGVLNVTPDSFSDGGKFLGPSLAVERALRMQEEGADCIDIGGESTRPGSAPVPFREEILRVLPVIKACAKALKVPISVDTYKAEVAKAAVGEGAGMVNDIGALRMDPRMGRTLAKLKVPVILMHMKGKPRTMQKDPVYRDLMGDLLFFFRERVEFADRCGISRERLLLDPGFGFGKTPAHNLELTARLWELKVLGRPLAFGPSRKSTLGKLLGDAPPEERLEATLACVTAGVLCGADLVRVHDVKETVKAVRIADAIRYGRGAVP